MIELEPLHPLFAAEVRLSPSLDLARLPHAVVAEIERALARYSVLVFRDRPLDDERQIAFSRCFGELETTKVGTDGAGSELVVLSNIGADGRVVAPSARQRLNNRANQQWHADSSFKANPARASLLSARRIPSRGGDTEYASMRAVYRALPQALRRRVDGRVAVHDYAHGRRRIDPDLVTAEERAAVPPVRQALVLDHGEYGRSLYIGAHCAAIEGLTEADSRALLDELTAFATAPRFVYRHCWRPHDLIFWNNRAVLHRATAPVAGDEKRLMVRTTIAGDGPTVAPLAPAEPRARLA